ncbi:hypothetical protein SAMN04488603_1207 [Paenibacillus sp. cl130]|nr:hypothetical protein SAMN04488603_1207 [Paenibacillus sp. cl130]
MTKKERRTFSAEFKARWFNSIRVVNRERISFKSMI